MLLSIRLLSVAIISLGVVALFDYDASLKSVNNFIKFMLIGLAIWLLGGRRR